MQIVDDGTPTYGSPNITLDDLCTLLQDLLPLVFMLELPMTGLLQTVPDASSPAIQQLQQQYNITISFRQRPRSYTTTIVVRGSVYSAKAVKEGTGRLMEQLTGNVGVSKNGVRADRLRRDVIP